MKTKPLITAVSAALLPVTVKDVSLSKADKTRAAAMAERKLAAIEAYGIAILEGSQAAASEWDQYVIARAMGGTDAEILTGAKRAIRMSYVMGFAKADRKAKAEEINAFMANGSDPHVKGFDASDCEDMERLATERTRQYRNRVNVLDDAGITLLGADGMPRSNVPYKGRTCSLSTVARRLQEERAGKNRGTKKRTDAPATDAPASDAPVSAEPNPANAALSPELISRVVAWMDSDTPEGAAIRAEHAESILHMAGAITLARMTAKAQPGKVLRAVRADKPEITTETPREKADRLAGEVSQLQSRLPNVPKGKRVAAAAAVASAKQRAAVAKGQATRAERRAA